MTNSKKSSGKIKAHDITGRTADYTANSKAHYAGVDGGATRTRCIVADEDGKVIGAAVTGPSNPLRTSVSTAAAEITGAVAQATRGTGVEPASIRAACLGVAGTRRGDTGKLLGREVSKMTGIPDVTVVTDAHAAFTGAIPGGWGVIALAGTGFIAFGMDGKGGSKYVDGLGPLLGDDGSAYSIGLEGLRSAARELDWRGTRTKFAESILDFLDVGDLDSLAVLTSKGDLDTARVASLAPLVLRACEKGSTEAKLIIEVAASRITDSIRAVAGHLDLGQPGYPVVLGGGLLERDGPLRSIVTKLVSEGVPGASLAGPFHSPKAGALALAVSGGDSAALESYLDKLKGEGVQGEGVQGKGVAG